MSRSASRLTTVKYVLIVVSVVSLVGATARGSAPVTVSRAWQGTCANLLALALPDTTITSAEEVSAGAYTPAGGRGGPLPDLPAFCRVALTVAPAIHVEVWMPRDNWNGRYVGEGGGGYAGQISAGALAARIREGYAAASTDTGHPGSAGGRFALNADGSLNMSLVRDFAERSLSEMAIKAKAIINAYYGRAATYSYWNGCSTGGRQGLMAVQRFPEQYDGLVIGAPAINWDRFIPAELWPQVVMNTAVGHPISAAKLNAATTAAIAACDLSDGVSDGVINNPRRCTYDPAALVCKAGGDSATCLTSQEATAIRKIWDGPTATDGSRLWFGPERGAALGGLAGTNPFDIAATHFAYWIHQDPSFDWHTLTEAQFERDFRASQQKFHDVIGTDEVNLARFRSRGGKMIIWHGEADQLIPPRGTVNYFNRVVAANGGTEATAQFARLYMAPGVGHCNGGVGPVPSGLFDTVVKWVEGGSAPTTIPATRRLETGVTRTRPLCPYPTTAEWTGSGSTDDAANFRCVTSNPQVADYTVR